MNVGSVVRRNNQWQERVDRTILFNGGLLRKLKKLTLVILLTQDLLILQKTRPQPQGLQL